jgi:hypothetical protein
MDNMKEPQKAIRQKTIPNRGAGPNGVAMTPPKHAVQFKTHTTDTIQFDKWKTGKVKGQIETEQKVSAKADEVDTAHHILPKKKLVEAYHKLKESEKKAIGKDMTGQNKVMSDKELMSLDFNLTLGPRPEDRTDDPGDEFDPNYDSGVMTPRSSELKSAWDDIAKGIDPAKLAQALNQAKARHGAGGKINRAKWSKANGKYTRQGKP